MKIIKEKIREDFKRDIYWTRIHFESEDKKNKSTLIVCASWEYILDINRINDVRDFHLNNWLKDVIKKWESLGGDIFNRPIYYDVYANTDEGRENGLEFLKKEIKP